MDHPALEAFQLPLAQKRFKSSKCHAKEYLAEMSRFLQMIFQ
jgi:hypothetical protein